MRAEPCLTAALAAVVSLLLAAGAAMAGAGPNDVVRALYSTGLPEDEGGLRSILTTDLAKAIIEARSPAAIEANGLVLDFDPVSDSQDPAVTDLAVKGLSEGAGKATVEARFKNGGRPTEIVYDLVEEAGVWHIRNIRRAETSDGGWDLRLILGLE